MAEHLFGSGLKNIYKGKRCFVIGNGPSLNQVDFNDLNDEITIGSNLIIKKFTPTFLCVSDAKRHRENSAIISSAKSIKVFSSPPIKNLREGYKVELDFKQIQYVKKIEADLGKTYWGVTVIIDLCLPLAYYLGITEVHLLGCDHNKVGRFYDSKLPLTSPSIKKDVEKNFKAIKEIFEKDKRSICDATKGGGLKMFRKVDLKWLLSGQ